MGPSPLIGWFIEMNMAVGGWDFPDGNILAGFLLDSCWIPAGFLLDFCWISAGLWLDAAGEIEGVATAAIIPDDPIDDWVAFPFPFLFLFPFLFPFPMPVDLKWNSEIRASNKRNEKYSSEINEINVASSGKRGSGALVSRADWILTADFLFSIFKSERK